MDDSRLPFHLRYPTALMIAATATFISVIIFCYHAEISWPFWVTLAGLVIVVLKFDHVEHLRRKETEKMTSITRINIDGGKYTIVFGGDPYEPLHILRHGETWLDKDIPGSKAWIAAACEIEELRETVSALRKDAVRLNSQLQKELGGKGQLDYSDIEI